jgi:hypothetical protein
MPLRLSVAKNGVVRSDQARERKREGQQIKIGATVHTALDRFEPIHLTFRLPVSDPRRAGRSDCRLITADAFGKALEVSAPCRILWQKEAEYGFQGAAAAFASHSPFELSSPPDQEWSAFQKKMAVCLEPKRFPSRAPFAR